MLATDTLTVTAGTPFDLAFLFAVQSSGGVIANGMNTALIDFTLPAGYTLTSELGWTSPAVVPEPAAVWLFGSGLLGLVGVARRKKSR